jgi:hypothetical protein
MIYHGEICSQYEAVRPRFKAPGPKSQVLDPSSRVEVLTASIIRCVHACMHARAHKNTQNSKSEISHDQPIPWSEMSCDVSSTSYIMQEGSTVCNIHWGDVGDGRLAPPVRSCNQLSLVWVRAGTSLYLMQYLAPLKKQQIVEVRTTGNGHHPNDN